MMPALTISIIILLLCNGISSNNIILTRKLIADSSLDLNTCTGASQCPVSDVCTACDKGHGPNCEEPACIDGKCGVIERCSQEISSTTITTPSNTRCIGTDASHCLFDLLCGRCSLGYSPDCSEPVCVNDQCKTILPCSIYTPTISSKSSASTKSSTPSTSTKSSPTTNECDNDNQCPHPAYCAVECKDGSGPLCTSAKCVNRKCQTISPCSQISRCTNNDLSQCIVPDICARCKQGYTPPCAQAVCDNGQCKIIMPCTIFEESTTTAPASDFCTRDDQCPRLKNCATKCDDGTSPLCASAKCIDGKCINIKPCSQRICKTRATCPYNKRNCVTCRKGYGPGCEQAACFCGICSIVPPCSKNLNIAVTTILYQGQLK